MTTFKLEDETPETTGGKTPEETPAETETPVEETPEDKKPVDGPVIAQEGLD